MDFRRNGAAVSRAASAVCGQTPLCVVLDGRCSGGRARAELIRLWAQSAREVLTLAPHYYSELSIITLHEEYYESRLPLGNHTAQAVMTVLENLAQEVVLQPLGLNSLHGSWELGSDPYPGLMPEHAVAVSLPAKAQFGRQPKRAKKAATSPIRRLFAVGEDSALAGLRSAASQLAAYQQRRPGGFPAHAAPRPRLEYWTSEPERFSRISGDVRHLAAEVPLRVLLFLEHLSGVAHDPQALARFLEGELRSADGRRAPFEVQVEVVPRTACEVQRAVRAGLGFQIPLLLRLPPSATAREIPLVATPTVLSPSRKLADVAELISSGCDLEVLCRVPSCGISCELLYGWTLLAHAATPHGAVESSTLESPSSLLRALVKQLLDRDEVVLVSAALSPHDFSRTMSRQLFAAFPARSLGGPPAIALHGVAAADNWQPAAMLSTAEEEETRFEQLVEPSAARRPVLADWPEFDPYALRCSRLTGRPDVSILLAAKCTATACS